MVVRRPAGRALVTLFEGEAYQAWDVRSLAREAGWAGERSWVFPGGVWRRWGWRHGRTGGDVREFRGGEGWEGLSDGDEGDDVAGGGGEVRRPGKWRGEERPARCYLFCLEGQEKRGLERKKKRRRGEESDSDED